MRAFYSFMWLVGLPLVLFRLWWRGRKEPGYRKHWGERLGIYFAEAGADRRPSKILYDRSNSALAEAKPGDIDWGPIFEGAAWFHTSGITPALSASAAEPTADALPSPGERDAVGVASSRDRTARACYAMRRVAW